MPRQVKDRNTEEDENEEERDNQRLTTKTAEPFPLKVVNG